MAEQRAERGDAHRTAHGAEEGDHRAGGAELVARDGVLHGEHQVLAGEAEADAGHRHVERQQGVRGVGPGGAHQAEAGGQHDGAADQVALPLAVLADELAGHGGGDREAEDHRQREQAGLGGGLLLGELEVLAEEGGGAVHADADERGGDRGERDGAVAEQVERDQRFGGALLDGDEQRGQREAADHHHRGLPGQPVVVLAGQRDPDHQQADGGGDQHRAQVVDLRLADGLLGELEGALQDQDGGHRERDAHVEAPAPAEPGGVHDDAADQRAADGGEREDRAEVAAVAAALARGDHRGQADLAERDDAAGADALQHPAEDQHADALRETGQRRGEHVDHHGDLDQQLLADQVGELAPERGGGGDRQQGGGDHPGVGGLAAVQVREDPRQCVGDDRGGQHGHEEAEQQAREGFEDLTVGHLGLRGCLGGRRHALPYDRKFVASSNYTQIVD